VTKVDRDTRASLAVVSIVLRLEWHPVIVSGIRCRLVQLYMITISILLQEFCNRSDKKVKSGRCSSNDDGVLISIYELRLTCVILSGKCGRSKTFRFQDAY
jgi:hypothetical protein